MSVVLADNRQIYAPANILSLEADKLACSCEDKRAKISSFIDFSSCSLSAVFRWKYCSKSTTTSTETSIGVAFIALL